MIKKPTTSKVELYRRLLKYPPFAVGRQPGPMRIVHHLAGGEVVAVAAETVTAEDAEKLYAAIYIAQSQSVEVRRIDYEGVAAVAFKVHIYAISQLTNCRNYDYIVAALSRLRALTITYNFQSTLVTTGLLHAIKYDKDTGNITILAWADIWDACSTKALTLNLSIYCQLSPSAKNLYSFLATNSGNKFAADTLIERSVIRASRSDNCRMLLDRALSELTEYGVIQSWGRAKTSGGYTYEIKRYSTAVGNIIPQQ